MNRLQATILAGVAVALIASGCGDPARSSQASVPIPPESAVQDSPAAPEPTSAPRPATADPSLDELPTRIVVPKLRIDLAVVSGDLSVRGNPPDYPLCDVAQYLTTYRFPGRPGGATN